MITQWPVASFVYYSGIITSFVTSCNTVLWLFKSSDSRYIQKAVVNANKLIMYPVWKNLFLDMWWENEVIRLKFYKLWSF